MRGKTWRRKVTFTDRETGESWTERLPWGVWWDILRWDWWDGPMLKRFGRELPCGCHQVGRKIKAFNLDCEDHGIRR